MPRLLIVRHVRRNPLPGVPPSAWPLAAGAQDEVAALRLAVGGSDMRFAASDELKAITTAELLGEGTDVATMPAFGEVTKPWFDDPSGHKAASRRYLDGEPLAG